MAYPVRLLLISSTCLLVFLSSLFLLSFISSGLYLLLFFSTVCTCCCFLAFNFRHKQRTQTQPPPPLTPNTGSSSSSLPSGKLTYDVFLSFRGTDTRTNFADHLYNALKQKGIFTFRDDDELQRGESIGPNLLKAIEESRYVIVVFSPNYAESAWCLDEVAKVAECMKEMGQKVLPVFYHVDPSEVRRQTGDYFGKAFEKHQKRFKREPEKVKMWKDALSQVGSLSGWHLQHGYESKVIQEIVENIFTELNKTISISEGLVGMDSHLNEMLSNLDIGCPDVRIIGICGMGGIGKTTIAQVVFERVQAQFEGCSFLENVREVIEKQGAVHLQQQLLSNLLRSNVNVQNTKMGKNIMRQRLRTKMVLVVLDDVDQEEQLEALCDRESFGPGSRIIITSRDEHLLSAVEGDKLYKVNPLNDAEALQLFSMKAFTKDQLVGEEILKLSKEFLIYANGLPLAVKVLGSSVKGRSVELWSSALDRLKKSPDKKIINVLRVSYDGLEPREKKFFLDVACFFKGVSIDRIRRILQGGDAHCPDFDIQVLLDKSMLTLFGKQLWMHDLIQEMGWEVVRQECPEEPGKRSRLWAPNEIINVLDQNKATSAVQSILLQQRTNDNVVLAVNDSFSNMDRLRLLKVWNVKCSGNIQSLSKELQFLHWHKCPLDSFPSDFQPDNLVELHMHSSHIKKLWIGKQGWKRLRLIDMSSSQCLMSTPDFTEVPFLEILVLQDCMSLVEVHPSLGSLKKLVSLNMKNCKSVESIPPLTSLESLKTLSLSLCSRLTEFPAIEGNMKCLSELHLDGTGIQELPPSVERLTGLATLNLRDCKNLLRLPSNIWSLKSLKRLYLTGCSKLEEIPANLSCVDCLEKLYIGETAIRELTFLIGMRNLQYLSCGGCRSLATDSCDGLRPLWSLTSLIELDLSYCNLMDGAISNYLSSLNSLEELDLAGNSFVRIPGSISQLSKLKSLDLTNCTLLQMLPNLPSSVERSLGGCISLSDFPDHLKVPTTIQSGLTTIESLDSLRISQILRVARCSVADKLDHEHTEYWNAQDHLSIPSPMIVNHLELSNYLPNLNPFNTIIAADDDTEWFTATSPSNSVSIIIPPDLADDNEWRGVFVGAVFLSKENMTAISNSEISDYFYKCTVETDVMRIDELFLEYQEIQSVGSDSHMRSIFFLPRGQFPRGGLNQSSVMVARFETNIPFVESKKCGIRLVYEQDDGCCTNIVDPAEKTGMVLNQIKIASLESGWFIEDDNRHLKWVSSAPPCMKPLTILLRKNIASVLLRFIEEMKLGAAEFKFRLGGSPAWFRWFETGTWSGSSVSTKLPKNLHKSKKWIGFAISTVIKVERHHSVRQGYRLFLQLRMGNLSRNPIEFEMDMFPGLFVVYIPRAQIPEALMQTSPTVMDISLRTDCLDVDVHFRRTGFRILYHENSQEFVDTIIRCMEHEETLEHYDQLLVKEWLQSIQWGGGLRRISTPPECDCRTRHRQEEKFELLSRKYRNWDWFCNRSFVCEFLGHVPIWELFPHYKLANSVQIQLPPNLFDDANWLGLAVCAVCTRSHEDPNIILHTPDICFNALHYCLETNVTSGGESINGDLIFKKLMPWEVAADWTRFFYFPVRGKHLTDWRQSTTARVTFLSSSPSILVFLSALRLVFKEDVGDLVQTLTVAESGELGYDTFSKPATPSNL